MKRYIIDHFEGEKFAVCEDESLKLVDIERSKLPKSAKEGDALIYENGEYRIDKKRTDEMKREIEKMMDDVWED
ncbi:DUF3006 domain-containing protein [Heyndrickxia coagulans]|uniref:DUF3006 domain-containing protein n=1 Tax=Heyndrickxia coagulans TaxID=1398 RepID=UPI00048F9C43|nr:DUF3006 domain-containing protein [Heyndrickxia coagulans]AJH78139.1 hypothetical protein BF29_2637 [Heyndrickxia coagulans DSM 1 = ATCC 7050]AJH79510.1 hypothetical protein BF29_2561 [Heyndrickxia coagulans DSM 1 = ATCC 7050]MDR4225538.1 DUF3006 domain-containing protein [Heyndrickxia coagulans DSM 1 = ATCC 7050]MED4492995.1 DUF3006 domain-containing protein [Heyndrickxia coagulans]MED4536338.1 DUF3006 domain-containing protein [Heyndrickxia coagulans]